ncbi:adenosylmethionine decarboxylase [Candidatus Falkowbacteria bacterium]|nr:adenosylmethionine decarboxylase [Candidatus Falkowbacteria bacterium]
MYISPKAGSEISCVMLGVDKTLLCDNKQLEKIFREALTADNFTMLEFTKHDFQPHGYSSLIILSESHAGIHTYPEHGTLFFYLHSCRGENDGEKALQYMQDKLQPEKVDISRRSVILG